MSSGKMGVRLARFRKCGSPSLQEVATSDPMSIKRGVLHSKELNNLSKGDSSSKKEYRRDSAHGKEAPLSVSPVYIGAPASAIVFHNTSAPSGGPRNNNGNNELQYRRCCFFWTCCCRCSCLNVRHHNQDGLPSEPRLDHLNGENESFPSIEDIRSWSSSFDKLMKSAVGRQSFREFLRCEYSEENILFWQAVEDLKRAKTPDQVEEKARIIYEDYISILSPKEVSLDSRVRDAINRGMVDPTTCTFDEAQTQIYTLMHRDSYPRYIVSQHYRRLAQLNTNGGSTAARKTSSAS